jgi:hypothetical protein
MSNPSSDFPFQVVYSEKIRNEIRDLVAKAIKLGTGAECLQALEKIDRQLHQDALGFGEPLYSLPAAKLKVRHAAISPLSAIWAVHDEQSLVFVKNVTLLEPPK